MIWWSILLLFLVIKFIKYHWNRRDLYKQSWKIPGPPTLPIIGNALIFACKNEDIFDRMVKMISAYSSPMRFWVGPKMVIAIRKPKQIEMVMKSTLLNDKDGDLYKYLAVFAGDGLITSSGKKWKNDRKLMSPLFSLKSIRQFIPIIVKNSQKFVLNFGGKVGESFFDAKKVVHRNTQYLAEEILLGETMTSHPISTVPCLIIAHARMTKMWLKIEWLFRRTAYYAEQEETRKKLYEYMRDIYQRSLREYKEGKANEGLNKSVLVQMLKIQDKIPGFANEEQFIFHMITLFAAFEDPVTTVTATALFVFGLFPDIQSRAYEEIMSICPNGGIIQEEDVNRMEYLERCVKEVLRLFPIAPFIIRYASEPVLLDDLYIPKNCSVIIAAHNLHRDEQYWESPNTFNPDHFLPNKVEERPKFAFIPFSGGARSCIGPSLAYLTLKILLASILKVYHIEAEGTLEDFKLKADISVRLYEDVYPIRLKYRQ